MEKNGYVRTEIANDVCTITFFHPQSNSLPGTLLRQLAATIEDCGRNNSNKVIVLKSEGEKAFCAGASFDELVSIDSFEKGKEFFSGFASVINAMRETTQFIIARVQGKAVGGGVGIASAADYVFAHRSASVKLSELAVGIGPFVVGPAVERKIGKSAFSALTINCSEWYSSSWALQNGLFNEYFDTHEALDNAVNNFALKLSNYNPEAMKMLKKIFWEGTDHWNMLLNERAELSGKLVLSDFTKKAISDFKKKK